MKHAIISLGVILILLTAGCGDGDDASSTGDVNTAGTPVEVVTVTTTDIVSSIDATGVVEARYDADVSAEAAGRVVEIVHDVGSQVSVGEPVIQLDDDRARFNLQQAEAQFSIARVARDKAEKDIKRMRELYVAEDVDVSESEMEQAELMAEQARGEFELADAALKLSQKALDDTGIRAPFDGAVTATYVNVGEMVVQGQIAYTIVQVDTIEIEVGISGTDIAGVRKHLPVEIRTAAIPDRLFRGEVASVALKANEVTRTYAVKILSENMDNDLRPGMLADVSIITGLFEDVIAIPIDAVIQRNGRQTIFVEQGGVAMEREITVASIHGVQMVISNGISAGERLIVSGQQSLQDGRKVIVTD